MKQELTKMDYLERAVMLQINQRLYDKGYISSDQYEFVKIKIVNFEA